MTNLSNQIAALSAAATPVAYQHTLHMEQGQTYVRLSETPESPFGVEAADTIEALRSEAINLQNTIARLTRELGEARDAEAAEIAAWLRSFDGQDEKAIAAGDCVRGSTTHGELRDQAAYYSRAADAIAFHEHRKELSHD